MKAPETLFVELTSECNSRCKYCHMWSLADRDERISTEEKLQIIREFAALNPNGEVVLTGGEPFLQKQEAFQIFKICRDLELTSSVNSNASLFDSSLIEIVLSEGPDYLVISLDSHSSAVHDYHRGIIGGFEHTAAILSEMVSSKRKMHECKTEIIVNAVVTALNIEHLMDTIEFIERLGVDGLTLQMLSPTYYRIGQYDKFFENHFFRDKPAAINTLQRLIDTYDGLPLLRTSPTDLFWMQRYIVDPLKTIRPICNSQERNLVVNHVGDARLCFNMSKIMQGAVLGNIREQTLETLWSGAIARRARLLMEGCNLSCGMLNCHRTRDL